MLDGAGGPGCYGTSVPQIGWSRTAGVTPALAQGQSSNHYNALAQAIAMHTRCDAGIAPRPLPHLAGSRLLPRPVRVRPIRP
jgi:hypothetical protein